MKHSFAYGLALTLIFSTSSSRAEEHPSFSQSPFVLQTSDTSPPLHVGDPTRWVLDTPSLPQANGWTLKAPEDKELQEKGWGLLPSDPKESPFHLFLVPLKPGELTLPPFRWVNKNTSEQAQFKPSVIKVLSGISPQDPQPDQRAPLSPPVSLPFPLASLLRYLLIASVLLSMIAFLVLYLWKKRKSKPLQPIAPPPVLTEDEQALADLQKLQKTDWILQGQFKLYYFRLSEILKTYLGARYQFDAIESTTKEILSFLTDHRQIESALLKKLGLIFEQLDRVKFTDGVPSADQPGDLLERVREWVESTRKIIPSPPTESSTLKADHAL